MLWNAAAMGRLAIVAISCLAPASYAKDIIVGTPPWQYKFATESMMVLPHAVDMSSSQVTRLGTPRR